jgi:hypothetical protein
MPRPTKACSGLAPQRRLHAEFSRRSPLMPGVRSLLIADVRNMNERHPEPEYALREGMIKGMYGIMIVNHALKGYRFKDEFSWHLWLDIEIKNTGEDGLPDEEEAEILNGFEDKLYGKLKEVCDILHIGRMTWNSRRELFYYLNDPEAAHQTLQAIIAGEPKREFQYEMSRDSDWERVNFIYNYE